MEALPALDAAFAGLFQGRQKNLESAPARLDTRAARSTNDDQAGVAIKYKRSDRTSLFVETQEGDLVRLQVKTKQSLFLRSSESNDGERVVAETTLRARSSTRIALTVQGDLNTDELTALQSLFEQVGALAEDFLAGDLPAVFAQAGALHVDPDQIANAVLRLRSSERLTYSGRLQAPVVQPAPSSDDATANPVATATSPVVSSAGAAATTTATAPAGDEVAAADDVAPSNDGAAATTDLGGIRIFEAILDFLTQLLDSLDAIAPAQDGEQQDAPAALDVSLKLKVFSSLVVTLSSVDHGGETDETDPLPRIIDAIASEAAPLNTVA